MGWCNACSGGSLLRGRIWDDITGSAAVKEQKRNVCRQAERGTWSTAQLRMGVDGVVEPEAVYHTFRAFQRAPANARSLEMFPFRPTFQSSCAVSLLFADDRKRKACPMSENKSQPDPDNRILSRMTTEILQRHVHSNQFHRRGARTKLSPREALIVPNGTKAGQERSLRRATVSWYALLLLLLLWLSCRRWRVQPSCGRESR